MQQRQTTNLRAAVKASIRRDSLLRFVQDSQPGYQPGWVHRRICDALERFSRDVAEGKSPRLMLFMPPRHGKSFIASERFPVWHLGHNPRHRVVVAGYGIDLPTRFSRKARDLILSGYAAEVFGARREGGRDLAGLALVDGSKAVTEWDVEGATGSGGGYKAVGVGSALTGHGADVLIIDDPIKDAKDANSETIRDGIQEWYESTARTRVMPGGGILVIMTRWHEKDLAGWLQAEAAADPSADQWEILKFPAIAEEDEPDRKAGEALHPERWPVSSFAPLMRFKATWAALYQQRPVAQTGNIFQWPWFKFYGGSDQPALPGRFDEVVQSWDCAFKDEKDSDFVVGQVWGRRGGEFWLLDQVRGQMGLPETVAAVIAMSRKHPRARAKYVEDKANGPAVLQVLRAKLPGLIAVNPEGGKIARAHAAAPYFQAGNVYLPDSSIAWWVNDLTVELTGFPKASHDDQVDALSQALLKLGKGGGKVTTIDQLRAIAGGR